MATPFKLVSESRDGPLMRWAGERCGVRFSPPAIVLAMLKNDVPISAAIFNDYTGENVELSFASDGFYSRRFLKYLAEYAFVHLGCVRVTARSRASNTRVANQAHRLGFKQEGVQRRFYGDEDAILFGLLRDEAGKMFRSHEQ